ncbi:MAG: fibronectin type III domain-containing protein [Thermaerobacter sp.]|nr:fibronectin type III domain-containing protein [Thermaerobacter sp.]
MRLKVFMVAALASTLIVAGSGSALAKGGHGHFEDLGNAQWAASAIETLSAQGLINGLTPTQFLPQDPVTIGQLAAILLRYKGQSRQGESFDAEVSQAQQAGMLSGLGGAVGTGDATRAQAMTMIMDALGVTSQGSSAQPQILGQFHDGTLVPGWARNAMVLAVQLGFLAGSGGDLLPQGSITRAELAVILQRVEADLGLPASSSATGNASPGSVHAGSVAGTVSAIGNGQITIAASGNQEDDQGQTDNGNLPAGTYYLSPGVKVVVPGEGAHGSVSQVQVGNFVRLVVSPGGLVHMIIVLSQSVGGPGNPSQGVPSGASASETATGIALSWTAVTGAAQYQVLESSGGAYAAVPAAYGGTPTASGTTITGLSVGTAYTFEVEAIPAQGSASSPSSPSAAIEWGARPGTTATVTTTTSGSLEWLSIGVPYDKALNPASLDTALGDYTLIDTATGQELGVANVSVSGSTLTIDTGTYPIGYFSNQGQAIRVTTAKSVVTDLAGAPTTPVDASGTFGASIPGSVSALEAATGVSLGWTPVSGAAYYQVLASSGGSYGPVASTEGGTPSTAGTTVTGLSAGTTYMFEVEAVNAAGQASAPSAPSPAVEWGARAGATAAVTVNAAGSGIESFTITITYDKALSASSLDTTLGDYTVLDATTHQTLSAASVSVSGNTLVIETSLYPTMSLSDTLQVTTAKSVVSDSVGAPTAPISATGTL